jgi:hypothetical protein
VSFSTSAFGGSIVDMNAAARRWYERGLNDVPQDMQAKHPSIKWKGLQDRRVTVSELQSRVWRRKFNQGIGVNLRCDLKPDRCGL